MIRVYQSHPKSKEIDIFEQINLIHMSQPNPLMLFVS